VTLSGEGSAADRERTAAIIEIHPSNRGQEYPSLAFVVWVKSFCHLLSSFLSLEPSVYNRIETPETLTSIYSYHMRPTKQINVKLRC